MNVNWQERPKAEAQKAVAQLRESGEDSIVTDNSRLLILRLGGELYTKLLKEEETIFIPIPNETEFVSAF